MTEPRGRAARWSAAALAAPVAAGLFAGATAWAQHADPLHASGTTGWASATSAPKLLAAPDPTLVALRQALVANAHTVEKLSKQVAAVRAQAAALVAANGRARSSSGRSGYAAGSGSGSSRSGGSGGSSGSGGSGGSQAPIVVTVPAAPPPPTQTTTGASGVPK